MNALRRTSTRLAGTAALAALTLALASCADNSTDNGGTPAGSGGSGGSSSASATNGSGTIKPGLKVAFLPKQVNNPYFDTSDNKGGKVAVGEFGGSYTETGPNEASPSAQVSYINTLSQQGTDVIVVSANDKDAICGALSEARTGGAKVVTYDSDTNPQCRDLFINQASTEGIAASQIKLISQEIGPGGGEIAILSATANATNQNAWIAAMKTELQKPDYSKLKLVATVYGDDLDQKSFQQAQGLLQTHPNLKGIISPTTVGVAAAARYLSSSSYKGKVALTGLGTPNQMRQYVKDGTCQAFALWNPADLGYLAAYAGGALASGLITGKEGDTFTAGKLGKFTVGANGEVLLGDPFTFDKSNIDQFHF
jgi:rhamnose transport system substrate-binding protein